MSHFKDYYRYFQNILLKNFSKENAPIRRQGSVDQWSTPKKRRVLRRASDPGQNEKNNFSILKSCIPTACKILDYLYFYRTIIPNGIRSQRDLGSVANTAWEKLACLWICNFEPGQFFILLPNMVSIWRSNSTRKSHVFIALSFMLFLTACEGFTEWERSPSTEQPLVVEAILTNELRHQEIKLSRVFSNPNDEVPGVTDALISVETNGVDYEFQADLTRPGTYVSSIPFTVVDNLTYNLAIEWEGTLYQASSRLSSVGPMPAITFRQIGTSENYTFVDFAPIISTSQQAMYEVQVDWSHLNPDTTNQILTYFYTFNSIHVNELIRPPKEQIAFPLDSKVMVKKYGLNDDYADFLMSMLIETEWDGNFYFANSENLPSNISNGAKGFFSTCAVVIDTLVVK
jgi:hypothetical protein